MKQKPACDKSESNKKADSRPQKSSNEAEKRRTKERNRSKSMVRVVFPVALFFGEFEHYLSLKSSFKFHGLTSNHGYY